MRTSDHGDLLGAHGGLHQKWFNLYDEATRVPVHHRPGRAAPTPVAEIRDTPTSHVDLVPTLLAAAGLDRAPWPSSSPRTSPRCTRCPGRDLTPVVDRPRPTRTGPSTS